MKHLRIMAVAVSGIALLAATGVQARELVYGSWVSPKHPINSKALPILFSGVKKETKGAITWKLVPGGALVKGRTTLAGIRDGLIDAGLGISVFNAKKTPSTAMIHSTLVGGSDNVAATGAQNETVMLHCPSCLAEWKKNNTVYLTGYAPTPFRFICRKNISVLADFKGQKVRASGGGVNLVKIGGGVPVNMTPAEATTALQRGTLDCVLGAVSWLKSYSYQDVAKFIVKTPMGMVGPALSMAMNRKTWRSLTKSQREAHWKFLPLVNAHSALTAYLFADDVILKDAQAVGVKVTSGEGFQSVIDKRVATQRATNIARYGKFGVKNPGKILDAYDKALAKWSKISKEVGTDIDKFAAAMKREIYDKVDPHSL
ncbi:MAG: C4-dicarboxylate TRAP transporter substrate-binding protein [Rhodospirillales bacterium]